MERSSYSEAIEFNQNFVTGLWLGNNFLDQRSTYTFVLFRPDQGSSSGAFFGDGQYGWQGRLTGLPIWDPDCRTFMHLGLSGGWRSGTNNLATSSLRTLQLRARPELRDDDPAGQGGTPAAPVAGGAQTVPNADSNRMIDTGAVVADHDWLMGLEALYVLGPFSVQAEYGWNFLDNVQGVIGTGGKLTTFKGAPQNYTFSGGYVQLAYTLTGESRGYDRKIGTLSRDYFGNRPLFNNAWLVRDEDGRLSWNTGAWELAARYSYTNLNDGVGSTRIQGGVMNGFSAGLNWYLNDVFKVQFDYIYDQRSDVPTASKVTLTNSTIPGFTGGFGMRVQLSF